MSTKKQIAANRRNAKHSSGPTSEAGKTASSMNALRHGLRARKLVLKNETQEDYNQLHDSLQNQFPPETPAEQFLVDQAAIAQWKLARAEAYEAASCDEHEGDPDRCCAIVARMSLATARLERSFFKAYKELERIKAARSQPAAAPADTAAKSSGKPAADPKKDDPLKRNVTYSWFNSRTGKDDVFYRRVDGVEYKYRDGELLNPDNHDPSKTPDKS
jgi:hypothetical protein